MYKLLLGLGVLDLAIHHPLLTALTLVGVFFFDNLTADERTQIKQTAMTIYSNSKQFSKYLRIKASELGIKLPELRKKVIIDLEVPEAATVDETNNGFDGNEEFEAFAKDFSPEERQVFIENEFAREKVKRVLLDLVRQPETVWLEGTLADFCLDEEDLEEQKVKFENWGIKVTWDKPITQKEFRQLKKKLKAVGRAPDSSYINEDQNRLALLTLERIENHFTNYQFTH